MAFNAEQNDPAKIDGGAWVELRGAKWLIARSGNAAYREELEVLRTNLPESQAERMEAEARALAKGILRGWEDVIDRNGDPIPFTVANATRVLLDNDDLAIELAQESRRREHFRREDIAEQGKKPRQRSSIG
ncbi:hypothetical protein KUV74_12535 [Halomonas sp. DP1Y21-3]|uniref:hypothetical protein n=1 Tax=Halomonas sp. DP1Y21-3 TaxID=2859080 RepID=UPI001C950F44|nr:hypothetical protein [Halomonas sp. DP1Y21-3]MBY6111221.1 hypothetical protein [Halomonas sp. DP1Y21-3]